MSAATGYVSRHDGGPDLRGNSRDRRRRREWLVETFRANCDVVIETDVVDGETIEYERPVWHGDGIPACRCYRCGDLLTVDTVTADRVVPGCRGGRYTRDNIRPACAGCNSTAGGSLRSDADPDVEEMEPW